MRCPICGAESSPGDAFCRTCGSLLTAHDEAKPAVKYCSECGAALLPDQTFCPACGVSTSVAKPPVANNDTVVMQPEPVIQPVQPAYAQTARTQQASAAEYTHLSVVLSVVALMAVFFVGGIVWYNMIQNKEQVPAATSQAGNDVDASSQSSDEESSKNAEEESNQYVEEETEPLTSVSAKTERDDNDSAEASSSNLFGIGGSYEVDSDGLVINKTYMFKFRIPAGYKGEMLTDNTILFRGKDFTVTIDTWFNKGETQESRYKNASNSLVSIDYETKSEGLFVVTGRDSRGHDMYTKEIIEDDSICRMVVDSEISPCSSTCEQAIVDFEGGFRLLR